MYEVAIPKSKVKLNKKDSKKWFREDRIITDYVLITGSGNELHLIADQINCIIPPAYRNRVKVFLFTKDSGYWGYMQERVEHYRWFYFPIPLQVGDELGF